MSTTKLDLKKALLKLDPSNPDHWTVEGSPKLEALGLGAGVKRGDITKLAPHFTREHPSFELPLEEEEEDEVNASEPRENERVGNFDMESSEFGEGDEPLHKRPDLPPVAATDVPELQHELARCQERLDYVVKCRNEIAQEEKSLDNRINELQQRMGLEVPAKVNQERIMAFLASTQKNPQHAGVSPLDRSHVAQRDPAAERPQFSNKQES